MVSIDTHYSVEFARVWIDTKSSIHQVQRHRLIPNAKRNIVAYCNPSASSSIYPAPSRIIGMCIRMYSKGINCTFKDRWYSGLMHFSTPSHKQNKHKHKHKHIPGTCITFTYLHTRSVSTGPRSHMQIHRYSPRRVNMSDTDPRAGPPPDAPTDSQNGSPSHASPDPSGGNLVYLRKKRVGQI